MEEFSDEFEIRSPNSPREDLKLKLSLERDINQKAKERAEDELLKESKDEKIPDGIAKLRKLLFKVDYFDDENEQQPKKLLNEKIPEEEIENVEKPITTTNLIQKKKIIFNIEFCKVLEDYKSSRELLNKLEKRNKKILLELNIENEELKKQSKDTLKRLGSMVSTEYEMTDLNVIISSIENRLKFKDNNDVTENGNNSNLIFSLNEKNTLLKKRIKEIDENIDFLEKDNYLKTNAIKLKQEKINKLQTINNILFEKNYESSKIIDNLQHKIQYLLLKASEREKKITSMTEINLDNEMIITNLKDVNTKLRKRTDVFYSELSKISYNSNESIQDSRRILVSLKKMMIKKIL